MNSSYGRPQPPPPGWTTSTTTTTNDPARSTTTVGLELEVNSFKVGKMRIRCVAELYGVFKATAETVLDEERPRLASILGTFSSAGKNATGDGRIFSKIHVRFSSSPETSFTQSCNRKIFEKNFPNTVNRLRRSDVTVVIIVTRILKGHVSIELETDDRACIGANGGYGVYDAPENVFFFLNYNFTRFYKIQPYSTVQFIIKISFFICSVWKSTIPNWWLATVLD